MSSLLSDAITKSQLKIFSKIDLHVGFSLGDLVSQDCVLLVRTVTDFIKLYYSSLQHLFFTVSQGLGFLLLYIICTVLQCDLTPLRPRWVEAEI